MLVQSTTGYEALVDKRPNYFPAVVAGLDGAIDSPEQFFERVTSLGVWSVGCLAAYVIIVLLRSEETSPFAEVLGASDISRMGDMEYRLHSSPTICPCYLAQIALDQVVQ